MGFTRYQGFNPSPYIPKIFVQGTQRLLASPYSSLLYQPHADATPSTRSGIRVANAQAPWPPREWPCTTSPGEKGDKNRIYHGKYTIFMGFYGIWPWKFGKNRDFMGFDHGKMEMGCNGIYMNLPYLGVQLLTGTSTGLTFISWDITPYNYGYTTYLFMELHPQVPSVNHGSGTYDRTFMGDFPIASALTEEFHCQVGWTDGTKREKTSNCETQPTIFEPFCRIMTGWWLQPLWKILVNGKDYPWLLSFHFPGAARHCARSRAAPKMLLTVQLPMVVGLDDVQGSENLSSKLGKTWW